MILIFLNGVETRQVSLSKLVILSLPFQRNTEELRRELEHLRTKNAEFSAIITKEQVDGACNLIDLDSTKRLHLV